MGLNIPKQYMMVYEQPVLNYCFQTFLSNENIDGLVIGAADEWTEFVKEHLAKLNPTKPVYYKIWRDSSVLHLLCAQRGMREWFR